MMTLEEFKESVDLYSADLSRWPVEMVKPALAVMEQSADAKKYFDEALRLDDILRRDVLPQADIHALTDKIAAACMQKTRAETVQPTGVFNWRPAWLFAPSGGLVVAGIIGFLIGMPAQQQVQADMLMLNPVVTSAAQHISASDGDIIDGGLF